MTHSSLVRSLVVSVVLLLAALGCDGGVSDPTDSTDDALEMKSAAGNPIACADPATISAVIKGVQTWFVYCTNPTVAWRTTNWSSFTSVPLTFNFGSLSALAQVTSNLWAPSLVFIGGHYVLWMSVPDGTAAQDRRSLAAFASPSPTGPWTFQGYGKRATSNGEKHIDPNVAVSSAGNAYIYWKSFGGSAASAINGAALGPAGVGFSGGQVKILDGFNSNGWEGNVRENPAVWQNPQTGQWHMLYSGGTYYADSYGTGHAISTCGPLCTSNTGWHIASANDRGIAQVMQGKGIAAFTHGGPGGADFVGSSGQTIVFAAGIKASDTRRYLFRQDLTWGNNRAPYVNTANHVPAF